MYLLTALERIKKMTNWEHFKAWLLVGLFTLLFALVVPIIGHLAVVMYILIVSPAWALWVSFTEQPDE